MSSNFFFFENCAVYEIMWKNVVDRGMSQMTTLCMRFAYWIPKATNTHSEYVILIAFPLQQWLTRTRLNVTLYLHCLSRYLIILCFFLIECLLYYSCLFEVSAH
jgi:hypothetical protein